MRMLGRWCVVAVTVTAAASAVAADLDGSIDLATFDDLQRPAASVAGLPLEDVAVGNPSGSGRFYVTGLLGSSFATLTDSLHAEEPGGAINGTVITAGGAAGVAYARADGQLRLEFEGRARDDLISTYAIPGTLPGGGVKWGARDGWSTLVNVWRDVYATDRLAVYLGGGIGAGGYRFGFGGQASDGVLTVNYSGGANVATFAWQAGGGAVYDLTERLAVDVGYRFYGLQPADTRLFATAAGLPPSIFNDTHNFTASELLFGLRVYEPFRRWR